MRSPSIMLKYFSLFLIIPLAGFSQEEVDYKSLVEKHEVYFLGNSIVPFTGSVRSYYDSGVLFLEGTIIDGKWEWSVMYYQNGQKQFENHLKNGDRDGTQFWWYENGQLKSTQSYEGGVLNGPSKSWWQNGAKMGENLYLNGILQN